MPNEDIALITLHNAIVRRNGKDILSIDQMTTKNDRLVLSKGKVLH